MTQPAPDHPPVSAPGPARAPARRVPRESLGTLLPAAIITALFHLALYGVARHTTLFVAATPGPRTILTPHGPILRADAANPPPVPAHLLPPAMRPAAPKFVEVNPMAPSAKPDHARNTGAADQRAAQPEPGATKESDSPRVTGTEPDSRRIVNATPREFLPKELRPAPGQPLGRDAPPATAAAAAKPAVSPRPAEVPKPKPVGPAALDRSGADFAAKPKTAPADPVSKRPEPEPRKSHDKPAAAQPAKNAPAVTRDAPAGDEIPETAARRPKASFAGTSGPLGINLAGVNDKGSLAVDSRFSRMGEYSQRLFEIIQASWWVGVDRARITERGQVVVEFTLHRDGSVADARIISSSTSERAALLCVDAITGRAPYDKWPEDMVAMFGDKQEGRITFTYY